MHSTVTSLEQDLQQRLEAAGMDRGTAQAVTALIPPAGRHYLCTELRDNENAFQELGHTWHLQELLRTTYTNADEIRARLLAVA